jgi:hypothetical protein
MKKYTILPLKNYLVFLAHSEIPKFICGLEGYDRFVFDIFELHHNIFTMCNITSIQNTYKWCHIYNNYRSSLYTNGIMYEFPLKIMRQ